MSADSVDSSLDVSLAQPPAPGRHAYAVAIAITGGFLALRAALEPFLGDEAPFLVLVAAPMLAAFYGGLIPGLFATVIAGGLGLVFFVTSIDSPLPPTEAEWARLIAFLVLGALASWLIDARRRTLVKMAAQQERLLRLHVEHSRTTAELSDERSRLRADTAARKRVEEELRNRGQQLETLLAQAPLGMCLVDADFRIVQTNPVAQRAFEGIEGGVVGRDFEEVHRMVWSAPFADEAVQILRRTLETGEPYDQAELVERRTDRGVNEYYEWRVNRITLPDGRHGLACYFRDVSEQAQAREAAKQLTDEAEERAGQGTREMPEVDRALEAFGHTIANDLRAPVHTLQSFAQALLEEYGPVLGEAGRAYAKRVVASAERLDRLTELLLAYARLPRGDLALERVDLAQAVGRVVDEVTIEKAARGARITVRGELPPVWAQPAALEQVLANLLDSAVKSVAPDVVPHLVVRAREVEGVVRLSVQENAIDIAPEHRPRILSAFEKLHGRDAYPDGGIGLAIVRKGIERMKGRCGLYSVPGRGNTFWVELSAA